MADVKARLILANASRHSRLKAASKSCSQNRESIQQPTAAAGAYRNNGRAARTATHNEKPANPVNFPNRYACLGRGRDRISSRPLSSSSLRTLLITNRQVAQIEKTRNKEAVTDACACLVSVMLNSPRNCARPNRPATTVSINRSRRQRRASSRVK